MPKRVSVKGRGADLFFGDEPTSTEPTPDVVSAAPVAQLLDSESPSTQEPATTDTEAPEAMVQRKDTKPTTRRKSPRPSLNTNGVGHTSPAALVPVDATAV